MELGGLPVTGGNLQVVFGAGQVGLVLAARLASSGNPVRSVSRQRPSLLAPGVDWRGADASDPEAAIDAAKGASVIYQCLNAPYTQWPKQFPPLQRAVLTAAERTDALLVSLENLYGYGPPGGAPMTEDAPLNATTSKGRVRAAMTAELLAAAQSGRVRMAIGRASDFFGSGVTESTLGARVFGNAVAAKARRLHRQPRPAPHLQLRSRYRGLGWPSSAPTSVLSGQVWHLPGPETVTTRAVLELIAGEVGHPVAVRSVPKLILRALGTRESDDAGAGGDGVRVRGAVCP
jgi:nucleoside-diphosphate-sugar epimerase